MLQKGFAIFSREDLGNIDHPKKILHCPKKQDKALTIFLHLYL